jgi:hypothetical protein
VPIVAQIASTLSAIVVKTPDWRIGAVRFHSSRKASIGAPSVVAMRSTVA